jgi:hypothetical protein
VKTKSRKKTEENRGKFVKKGMKKIQKMIIIIYRIKSFSGKNKRKKFFRKIVSFQKSEKKFGSFQKKQTFSLLL